MRLHVMHVACLVALLSRMARSLLPFCQRRRSFGALCACCHARHARHCSSATNRRWRAQTVSPRQHTWQLMRNAFLMHSCTCSHLARGPPPSMTNYHQLCFAAPSATEMAWVCAVHYENAKFRHDKLETSMLHECFVRVFLLAACVAFSSRRSARRTCARQPRLFLDGQR